MFLILSKSSGLSCPAGLVSRFIKRIHFTLQELIRSAEKLLLLCKIVNRGPGVFSTTRSIQLHTHVEPNTRSYLLH